MVGIDRKNENSNAEARDMPASCPAAMVDIEREVPGNTADKIWHNPTQIACPRLISSIFQVRIGDPGAACPAFSHFDLAASMTHINRPPMSKDEPITARLSRFFPITLVSKNDGRAVITNAIAV